MENNPAFRRNLGQGYTDFLDQLHATMAFDWYLEIGCRNGRSFGPVRGKTIAVDPYFKVDTNIIGVKPRLFVFQQTSDDFFADAFLDRLGIRLSFSFLDGMHLFEFLLRDFIQTEAHSDPGGVIALHDCLLYSDEMMTRNLRKLPRGAWTGDVWKLLPILQKWRPDLTLTVLSCHPTGLVLVSGLDPGNDVLVDNYAKIVAEWTGKELRAYGLDRFYAGFDPVDPQHFAADGYAVFDKVRLDPARSAKPKRVTK